MPESYSPQMEKTIDRLRRFIGDTDEDDYEFETVDLFGYVGDAVSALEFGDYSIGVSVDVVDDVGMFVDASGSEREISDVEITLYARQAQVLIKLSEKDKSDRDSISISKKNLSVNTSSRSQQHGETLEYLQRELRRLLFRLNNSITGVRVE